MKAAYRKFEEERMPELKQEWPTLKHTQLLEKLQKEVRNLRLTLNLFFFDVVEEESSKSNEHGRWYVKMMLSINA